MKFKKQLLVDICSILGSVATIGSLLFTMWGSEKFMPFAAGLSFGLAIGFALACVFPPPRWLTSKRKEQTRDDNHLHKHLDGYLVSDTMPGAYCPDCLENDNKITRLDEPNQGTLKFHCPVCGWKHDTAFPNVYRHRRR